MILRYGGAIYHYLYMALSYVFLAHQFMYKNEQKECTWQVVVFWQNYIKLRKVTHKSVLESTLIFARGLLSCTPIEDCINK